MATSGTTTFNPDLGEMVEEAYERAGVEFRTGHQLKTARRSLNFLLGEWANKGLNLWTIEEATISLVAGTSSYNLPTDCVDIIEHVVRTTVGSASSDRNINREPLSTWMSLANKAQTGIPTMVVVERNITPSIKVWPVPDQAYTLVYAYLRRLEDAGSGVAPTLDIPFRFYNAMAWGLSWHLAIKHPGEAKNDPAGLKVYYDEAFALAAEEDRDRSGFFIKPRIY
jgi:hypothetical protein